MLSFFTNAVSTLLRESLKTGGSQGVSSQRSSFASHTFKRYLSYNEHFRVANDYAESFGFAASLPTFDSRDQGEPVRLVYNNLLLNNNPGVTVKNISAAELGYPNTFEERFRAIATYSGSRRINGHPIVGGFPNFHQADYGQGLVYGVVLLDDRIAERKDVPMAEVGGNNYGWRMYNTRKYATNHGYLGGFPNFHQQDYGHGVVFGTILIKNSAGIMRDIPLHILNMYNYYTFDPAITRAQRLQVLERHAFGYSRVMACSNLNDSEKSTLINQGYKKKIHHDIDPNPNNNASGQLGGNKISINFNVLFPQGPREIAQTLIHETMHLAGFRHPDRTTNDRPNDNGPYYGSPPLRSELCIAGMQSLALRCSKDEMENDYTIRLT